MIRQIYWYFCALSLNLQYYPYDFSQQRVNIYPELLHNANMKYFLMVFGTLILKMGAFAFVPDTDKHASLGKCSSFAERETILIRKYFFLLT